MDEQGAAGVTTGRPVGEERLKIQTGRYHTQHRFREQNDASLPLLPSPVPASEGLSEQHFLERVDGKIDVAETGRDEVLFADSPGGFRMDWIE